MHARITELLERITQLEDALEAELSGAQERLRYTMEAHRPHFDPTALAEQFRERTSLLRYLWDASILSYVTAPVIYALIVPLALLDLAVWIYQGICFPAYGIQRVRRRDYLTVDRHHLAYLNPLEKLNCVYCSYANGLVAYVREVTSRTEQYWCPIKHAQRIQAPHHRYYRFLDYGDAKDYRQRLEMLRTALRNEPARRRRPTGGGTP